MKLKNCEWWCLFWLRREKIFSVDIDEKRTKKKNQSTNQRTCVKLLWSITSVTIDIFGNWMLFYCHYLSLHFTSHLFLSSFTTFFYFIFMIHLISELRMVVILTPQQWINQLRAFIFGYSSLEINVNKERHQNVNKNKNKNKRKRDTLRWNETREKKQKRIATEIFTDLHTHTHIHIKCDGRPF